MRLALVPAALLATCCMAGAAGFAGSPTLTCSNTDDALAARLCDAVGRELCNRGHAVAGAESAAPRLVLRAHSPRPDMLRARLTVEQGAAHRDGPELELSVMDRGTVPDRQLEQLARLLLDQTLPVKK